MAGNIRNSRTTFPRKQARRTRAAERFFIDKARAEKDPTYAKAKAVEAAALDVSVG